MRGEQENIKSGVYLITNKVSGDFYIGSSKNLPQRLYQHRHSIRYGKHENIKLQASFDKTGLEAMEIKALVSAPVGCIHAIEKQFIKQFKENEKCLNIKG